MAVSPVEGLSELPALIAHRAPRMLVIGDVILDTWLTGSAGRLSREAPVPVVEVTERRPLPGGAGNTAASLAALGTRTTLLGVVGDDDEGAELRAVLIRAGVEVSGLVTGLGLATVNKQRVLCGDTVLARWDRGRPGALPSELAGELARRVACALAEGPDAVVVADYETGGVPEQVLALLARYRDRIGLLVVDAHRPGRWAPTRPDVVTPNVREVAELLEPDAPGRSGTPGGSASRVELIRAHRSRLVARTGAGMTVVTMDRDGSLLLPSDPGLPTHHVPTQPTSDSRACGAGDVFTAILAAALACAVEPPNAVRFAQAGAEAAIAAGRRDGSGTVAISVAALAARLAAPRPVPLAHDALADAVAGHRRAGRRVVFTNGCFDVLHRGHIAYLEQARRLGDVLIVALNSDASVARLKGPDRPVNPAADRAMVLAALRCVDHVVVFTEDTPVNLIELVRPEVYAKGGDYTPQMLPETPVVRRLGGEVRVLDYLSDHSTSAIVARIRNRTVPAGEPSARTNVTAAPRTRSTSASEEST